MARISNGDQWGIVSPALRMQKDVIITGRPDPVNVTAVSREGETCPWPHKVGGLAVGWVIAWV